IELSHATGDVSVKHSTFNHYGESMAGGLAGDSSGTIARSFATGSVFNEGGLAVNQFKVAFAYAGGLAGRALNVHKSFATGPVQAGHLSTVGGLVGRGPSSADGGHIANSYATGAVTIDHSFYVGGFAGYSGSIFYSYSTGKVVGDVAGGFVGY